MKARLAVAAAAFLLGAHAHAQTRPGPDQETPAAASNSYRSAFEGYQSFTEEPLASWREVNDAVARVGGHMGVLRAEEAAATAPDKPRATPSAPPSAAPHSMKDAHGQHHK